MSVRVDLDQLADTLASFSFAYLITVGDDFHAHTVAVDPVLSDGVLDIGSVGNTTRRNAAERDVTVIWPPREPGGYTLIVDGVAELSGDQMRVVPGRAVLHRKATTGGAKESGCKDDCVPLDTPAATGVGATGVIADLAVADLDTAKSFYVDYLGLSTEQFNLGWVARYSSPATGAAVQLVTHDETATENPVTSVFVDDIDGAYAEALRRGYEIVHPLTTEPWGVSRFFVRAPDGNVHNIVNHRER